MPKHKTINLITFNALMNKISDGSVGEKDYTVKNKDGFRTNVNLDAQTAIGGYTALMVAADQGNFEAVSTLLQLGGDPNIQNSKGKTALMYAVRSGDKNSVELLLEAGADPTITNKAGHSAYYYADAHNPNDRIKKMLEEPINKKRQIKFNKSEFADVMKDFLYGDSMSVVSDVPPYEKPNPLSTPNLRGKGPGVRR